ncbi:MAG: hypothetical protein ACTS3R_03190 [Inquilinaceae bacterium]
MDFIDQKAAKLLCHAINQLGSAVGEVLCVEPDRTLVRLMLDQAKANLAEFEDAYFDLDESPPPRAAPPGTAVKG